MSTSVASNHKASFAELARDIDWQRASFFLHCLDIVRPKDSPLDPTIDPYSESIVNKILDDYLLLGLLFYGKFRADLSNRYNKTDEDIQEIEVKILLQSCLEKLINEWHRVYAVILAIRADKPNNPTILDINNQLKPVLNAALVDLYLPMDFNVILQFGKSYSLQFSNYTDSVAALSVPTMALQSPWEWTFLWHELAGEKIRLLKDKNNDFFVTLFNVVMDKLNDDDDISKAENFGWSVEWFEELFEDSFTINNFPIHFLYVFKNLLERYPDGGKGNRHPFRAVRLAVGMSLYLQINGVKSQPSLSEWDDDKWSKTFEALKDDQSLTPGRFSEFDPTQLLTDSFQARIAWLAAEEILNWHDSQMKSKDKSSADVKDFISDAIRRYSTFTFSRVGNRESIFESFRENVRQFASDGVKKAIVKSRRSQEQLVSVEEIVRSMTYSDKNKKALDILEDLPENLKIKKLLLGGDIEGQIPLRYDEMLNIPFDYVDYLMTHVKEVSFNNQVQYTNFTVFRLIQNHAVGTITYMKDNDPTIYRTTPMSWNTAAPDKIIPKQ